METKKVDFLEEKPGVKSFTRLSIAWYFWTICVPGSAWILYVLGTTILNSTLTASDGLSLIASFIILQLGWIAPKQLAKINEIKELISQPK